MKKKIAVFGGTFDPVHNGHIRLAEWLHRELKFELIYFVPAAHHAFKINSKISAPQTRLLLLETATAAYDYMKISRIEIDRKNVSYTIKTLEHFKDYEKLSDAELYFVIGKDNLPDFHRWKDPERILDLVKLLVLSRSGLNGVTKLPANSADRIIIVDSPCIDISSSEIRDRIEHGKSYKNLLPDAVYQLIEENRLYR